MAGKHVGAGNESASIGPNYIAGGKIDRAYAEGRQVNFEGGSATDNPHDGAGTPEESAWDAGFNGAVSGSKQYETARTGASALYNAGQEDVVVEFEGTLVTADPVTMNIGVNNGGIRNNPVWRFTNVAIAQGTSISSATLTLGAALNSQTGTPDVDFFCQDIDNALTPADGNCPGNTGGGSWTQTTADTNWDGSTLTVDVTTAVQEVLDRVGWVSGNAINVGARSNIATLGNFRQIQTPTAGTLVIT